MENLNKPVASSTVSSPAAAQSTTSSTSVATAAPRLPKQPAPRESCSKPVLNGKSKLNSSTLVPYGAESSEDSDEESRGLVKENGHTVSFNGVLIGNEESVPETASPSCHNAAEEEELPPMVSVNGIAIEVDDPPKENGLAHEEAASKSTENLFAKANGLLGKVSFLQQLLCVLFVHFLQVNTCTLGSCQSMGGQGMA